MLRFLAAIAAGFLLFSASAAARAPSDATVTIGPEDGGNWRVTYAFEEPQSVLAFARSSNDYRTATWTLTSDNARFGRVGQSDVIVFDEPATEVSFSIIPLTSKLTADYTPFVTFSDGGLAVYEGQFVLIPFDTLDAVQALEGEPLEAGIPPLDMSVRLSSERPLIVDGAVHEGSVEHAIEGDGTYIYTGNSEIDPFESFTAVLDTGLPRWLLSRFAGDLETIFEGLASRWGFELENKATVMLAYKGGTQQGLEATGGALDQLLMMEVGGEALAQPDFNTLSYLQWFFAHEAVHLFQIDQGVGFPNASDAWIHEGAANTMAYNLIASTLEPDQRKGFLAGVYANAFEACVSGLEEGPLAETAAGDPLTAHYACGDFIALATDGFLKRRDLYGFWNRLLDRATSLERPEVTADLYFTTMQLLGATKGQRDMIRRLVEEEVDDPRKALTTLLEKAGLDPQFNDKGQLVSLDWPDYAAQ